MDCYTLVRQPNGVTHLTLRGDLDVRHLQVIHDACCDALTTSRETHVDCDALQTVDAAVAQWLWAIRSYYETAGHSLLWIGDLKPLRLSLAHCGAEHLLHDVGVGQGRQAIAT